MRDFSIFSEPIIPKVKGGESENMTIALKELTNKVLSLPVQKRAELAHSFIQSIDGGAEQDVSSAWDVELEKRVREIREGKVKGIPADEVFAKLRGKYRLTSSTLTLQTIFGW